MWFSGRKRRRRDARETTQRGADSLCLATGRSGQESQRSVSGDGGITAGGLQLEAAIRGIGIERAAGTPATARRKPQAEGDRSGPHVGQTHSAGSAIKKGLKPAKRRELVRQVRQAYRLSENRACGLMRITRWSNRYQSRRDPQTELRVRLRDLAATRIRFRALARGSNFTEKVLPSPIQRTHQSRFPAGSLKLDVKFVPRVGRTRQRFYQFTAIDEATRFRVLRIYDHNNTKTAIDFLGKFVSTSPWPSRKSRRITTHRSDHSSPGIFPISAFRTATSLPDAQRSTAR